MVNSVVIFEVENRWNSKNDWLIDEEEIDDDDDAMKNEYYDWFRFLHGEWWW
jgi:hypothetical protein